MLEAAKLNINDIVKKLLKPPETFQREKKKSNLFTPYSAKNNRRLYCYTEHIYTLYVLLEWSSTVGTYNVQPESINISSSATTARLLKPSVVSKGRDGRYTIHLMEPASQLNALEHSHLKGDAPEDDDYAHFREWCHANDLLLQRWTPATLVANDVLYANRAQLLRYISSPTPVSVDNIAESARAALLRRRKLTVASLLRELPGVEEDLVLTFVAQELAACRCHADIDRYPFHYSTELSVHGPVA